MVAGIASAQDVIEISTVDQLKEFRDAVNGGNGYAGKTVKLTADLDLSSESNWKPIGNLVAYPSQSFNGIFDGDNHVISNLTVNDNTPENAVAGLFGSVVNGTIKNLTVKNVNIQSTHFAGGIVAYTSNGPTIENCKVIGGTIKSTPELQGTAYNNGDKVGGIMGYATAGSTINNCWVEGVTITGYRDLGGIAGFSAGNVTNNTVKNVTVQQDLTNGYKETTPTTIDDILGRDGGATLSNNVVIKSDYVAQIGETQYETLADAVAAANAGDVIEVIKAGDYTLPSLSKNVTVEGAVDGVVFTHTTAGNIASTSAGATFKNVKFVFGNVNYHGFQHAGTINMENCTLDGKFFSYGDMNFTNCEFTQSASDYHMWCYSGDVTYTGCTFTANGTGKFLNIYNEDGTTKYTVTVENCKFVNTVAANKAALNVKATSGANLLQFDVIVKNCTTEGNFPEASSSQALVVLNNVVQVDDRTADGVDNIKVWQDDVLIYPVNYVAQIGDVKYMTLQAALDAAEAANTENFVIDLLADAELDITAWDGTKNPLSIGTVNTQSITINGNNHKLTFNQKDSDWNNVATMNDAQTKLVLNDMTISSAGYNDGPWNRHDINFNCAVELNNVTSDKALAFKNDATLKNVTISDDSGDIYAVWISPRGQKVDIDGLTINCGRGIKIDDEYSKTPYDATLNIANATFYTTKKSAILVKNNGETTINAGEGINIEHAAADTVNPIWVDEDKAEEFYKLTVTGANVVPESKESDYVACLMKGEQRWGYYKGTNALSKSIAKVEEGWSIKLHQTTTEAVEVSKPLVITKNGFTADNVTAGEGFVREETNDEIIIKQAAYVAQIGDVKYTTLAAAVEAVPADGSETTIVMIDNSDIVGNSGVTIPTTKNVKLDLNGKTVTLKVAESKGSQLITNNGTLTITDSSDEKNGKLTNAAAEGLDVGTWPTYNYVTNIVTNSGNLTIEAGNIVSTANGSICYAVDNNSTSRDAILNVKGGYMTSVGTVVRQFCNSATNKNVVNISDGVIETNGSAALWVQLPGSDATKAMKAELNVSGGTLSGKTYAFYDYSSGNAFTATQYNLSGGTFNGGIFSYGANITISDGTYNSWVAIKQTAPSDVKVTGGKFADDVYTYGDNASEAFISGGIYATKTYEEDGNTYDCDWMSLLAEGYEVVENTDEATKTAYPWAVKEKAEEVLVELIDGKPYPYPEGKECTSVTYKRTFKDSQIDKPQPWFVPFDYTITAEDMENFTFYGINMIASAAEAGEVEDESKVYIYIKALDEGYTLKANRPYVVKPKSAMTDHIFKAENITKVYAEDYTSRLFMATTPYNYNFYGNYRAKTFETNHQVMIMGGGKIGWNGANATLGSYRWYIQLTPNGSNDDYANIALTVVEEDGETNQIFNILEDNSEIEGIYTIGGIKVEKLVKGVNLIRFKNGQTKKVYIK